MSGTAIVTRFAPSPTGDLHLGNAHTALFNALLARRSPEGRFLLRIEDTDATRSRPEYAAQLMLDLHWLGIEWDEPPLLQSQRAAFYDQEMDRLLAGGHAYPCFCSARELELARAAQLSSGKPPRYSGRCRNLSEHERATRTAAGEPATLRFRVPDAGITEFDDMVFGPRQFPNATIGDFILRRADGTAAFFFSNAVDDSASGVTHVLRGDDHLSNTPRQLMILAALGRRAPRYGHLALLTGHDGAPLSKRNGSMSVARLKAEGYLPAAVANHLFRLGHSSSLEQFATFGQLAAAFDENHLQRAPAHFELAQLRTWQKEAVHRLDVEAAIAWLGPRLPDGLAPDVRHGFVMAVLPNLVLPDDVLPWIQVAFGELTELQPEAESAIESADRRLFVAASAAAASGSDFAGISAAARAITGLKGPALFKPLRAALTGRLEGPELGPLLKIMSRSLVERRLARFA
jgi:glutamyl-tRNA synthetase